MDSPEYDLGGWKQVKLINTRGSPFIPDSRVVFLCFDKRLLIIIGAVRSNDCMMPVTTWK